MNYTNFTYDTVLMVDDDPIANLVHRKIIEKTGIAPEIRSFTDPGDALDYLHAELARFEGNLLVLLDINMPEMSGFEFLDSISRSYIKGIMPDIVMVTSSIDYGDMERGSNNPLVNGYMTKPLTGAEILNFARQRSQFSA